MSNYTYRKLYDVLFPYRDKGAHKFNGGFGIRVIENIDWGKDISYGIIAKITRGDEAVVLFFNDVFCIVEGFDALTEIESLVYPNSNYDLNIPNHISSNDFLDPLDISLCIDFLDELTGTKQDNDDVEEEKEEKDIGTTSCYTYGTLYRALEPYVDKGIQRFDDWFSIEVIDNVDCCEDISRGLIARITKENEVVVLTFDTSYDIAIRFDKYADLKSLNCSNSRLPNIPILSANNFADPLDIVPCLDLLNILPENIAGNEHDISADEEEENKEGDKTENSLYREFSKKARELKELFYDDGQYNKAKEILYNDICSKYQNDISAFTECYLIDSESKNEE